VNQSSNSLYQPVARVKHRSLLQRLVIIEQRRLCSDEGRREHKSATTVTDPTATVCVCLMTKNFAGAYRKDKVDRGVWTDRFVCTGEHPAVESSFSIGKQKLPCKKKRTGRKYEKTWGLEDLLP
jgi:hypothetical protein